MAPRPRAEIENAARRRPLPGKPLQDRQKQPDRRKHLGIGRGSSVSGKQLSEK